MEGTHEGLAATRARGKVGGRKLSYTPQQVKMAQTMKVSTSVES